MSFYSQKKQIVVIAFNKSIASELREKVMNLSKYDSFIPSSYQKKLIDFVVNGKGNGIVQAVAGSGKTTTIMQALGGLRTKYGTKNVTEEDWRGVFYGNVKIDCKTTHSLFLRLAGGKKQGNHNFTIVDSKTTLILRGGDQTVKTKTGNVYVPVIAQGKELFNTIKKTSEKYAKQIYMEKYTPKDQITVENLVIRIITKLVGICKNTGVGFFPNKPMTIKTLKEQYYYYELRPYIKDNNLAGTLAEIEEDDNGTSLFDFTLECLEIGLMLEQYWDMDDTFYMSAMLGLWKKYNYKQDFIFVDECQDTNLVTQFLIKQYLKPNKGRAIAVGDVSQAIYMFTGAHSQAMQAFKDTFKATEIPLSLCYRCGSKIIEITNQIFNYIDSDFPYTDIQPLDTLPRGTVDYMSIKLGDLTTDQMIDLFDKNSGVICRKNAPLLSLAQKLFLRGIPVNFLGRDKIGKKIGFNMQKMKNKFAKGEYILDNNEVISFPSGYKHKDKDMFSEYLAIHKTGMDAYLAKNGTKSEEDDFADELLGYELVLTLLGDEKLTNKNIDIAIDQMFSEEEIDGAVTLCSVHRSKGLEFHRAIILDFNEAFLPKFVTSSHMYVQECNMVYVAYTRAERELVFLDSGTAEKK